MQLTPINDIMSRATIGAPEPEVGMGATQLMWSDRYPFTIIAVSKNKNQIIVQRDDCKRTDTNGMSDSQSYEFTPNPQADTYLVRRMPGGEWRVVSLEVWDERGRAYPRNEAVLALLDKRKGRATGSIIAVGYRDRYYDFSL